MHPSHYGVSAEQMDRYHKAKEELKAAEQSISETALASIGLKKGDLIEDTSTGLHYRLDWCSIGIVINAISIHVSGRRVWKSGRKAGQQAHSHSFLSFSSLVKIDEPKGGDA